MKDDSTIGAQIRDLRRRRGLTQEDLAAKAGLSRDVIKKIESGGSARMSTYHAIARALGVVTLTFAAPRSPEPVPAAHNDAALAEIRSAINPPTGIDGQPLFKFNGDAEPSDPEFGLPRALAADQPSALHPPCQMHGSCLLSSSRPVRRQPPPRSAPRGTGRSQLGRGWDGYGGAIAEPPVRRPVPPTSAGPGHSGPCTGRTVVRGTAAEAAGSPGRGPRVVGGSAPIV